MPLEAPGQRVEAVATKAVNHGNPAVELNFAGIAAKSQQVAPMVPSVANAAIAQQIAIGESFIIMLAGRHQVASSALPAGAVAGTQLWIATADNSLQSAAAAGRVKFGVVESINATAGTALVNLSQRGSF